MGLQIGAADGVRERLPRVVSELVVLSLTSGGPFRNDSLHAEAAADFLRRIAAENRVINKKTGNTSMNVIPML